MKIALETYLREVMVVADEKDRKLETIEDPGLAAYVNEHHPRFYELCQKYGSPLSLVNLMKEGKNIAQTSAKVTFINLLPNSNGKEITKKMLLSMPVTDLKALIAKLLKVEVLKQDLTYMGPEDTQEYPLDEEYRQLSFYSMADGGKIFVRERQEDY